MSDNRDRVLRKIARRAYSTHELRLKLKGEIPEIEAILEDFVSKGYLNDEEWLKSFVRVEQAKGKGPLAIIQRLRAKGYPSSELKDLQLELDPEEALKVAIQKKSKGKKLDFKSRQKLVASLFRLGFSWDLISKHLPPVGGEAEDVEEYDEEYC